MYPKLISIGSFYLPTYGVLVALGFLAGLYATVRIARKKGLNTELITNLAVYVALMGLLGAKILMLMFDWPGIAGVFTLSTLQAAGVFQGGLILAVVFAFVYMRRNAMPMLATADVFAPGIAVGHAIGRLGCFAAGCCWGQKCDRFWAVQFHNPDAALLTGVPLDTPLHPSQLYEFTTEGILFFVLYRLAMKDHPPGRILGLYLVISSIARFLIEFTRNHEQALPFGLPLSITQWIAIALTGAGLFILKSSVGSTRTAKVRPQTA